MCIEKQMYPYEPVWPKKFFNILILGVWEKKQNSSCAHVLFLEKYRLF